MLIKNYPMCQWPYKFKYDPPAAYVAAKRPLMFTELKRPGTKSGFLRVEPGEMFELNQKEYMILFLKDSDNYSHEFIKPIDPDAPKEEPKAAKSK